MNNKIITIAAIALVSAFSAVGVSAHVSNGGLVSGNGSVVKSAYTGCVRVSSGVRSEKCGDVKAVKPVKLVKTPLASKAVPKAAPIAVSFAGDAIFAIDSAELTVAGKAELDNFVVRAKQLNLSGISVVGHADSIGEPSYNQMLSENRANTVKAYLESKGILGSLIRATGEGENSPFASNNTEEGRAQNRRVDITVRGYTK